MAQRTKHTEHTEHTEHIRAKLLTERDYEILRFTGTQGVASVEQLARRFWPNARLSTAQDRLTQLVRSGYLQTARCHVRCDTHKGGELVYCLTRMGLLLFSPPERARLQAGLPPANDLKHRLLANEARITLEEQLHADGGRLISWRGERELRADCGKEVARQVAAGVIAPMSTVIDTPNTSSTSDTSDIHNTSSASNGAGNPTGDFSSSAGIGRGIGRGIGGGGSRLRPTGQKRLDIADARAIIQNRDGAIREIDIEIDGQYYGKMLQTKAAGLGSSNRAVMWVCCSAARVAAVTRAVSSYSNITVMQL